MKKALFVLALVIAGNAVAGDEWRHPDWKFDARNNKVNTVTVNVRAVDNVTASCEAESRKRGNGGFGFNVLGCSFWNHAPSGNTCTIIIPKQTTKDNLGHEMLHCLQGSYH